MGVFLRDKIYWISYCVDGKQVRRSCDTANKTLAIEIYHKYKTLVAEGKHLDKKKEGKTRFRDFANTYLERHAKIYKKSWKSSDKTYLNRILPVFGDHYLSKITSNMVVEYMAERRKRVTAATVNRELSTIKIMFSKAEEWNVISENPIRKVKKLKGETTGRTRYLTSEEMALLLAASDSDLRDIILILIHTGMRRGEMLRVQWVHVDFEIGAIFIPVSKNGKSRYVPMNDVVRQILWRRRNVGQNKEDFVFDANGGNISTCNFRKRFEAARKLAGLNDLRLHDLRHTTASHLVMKGVDLSTVQAILGHSDQRVTERYSHLSPVHKARAIKVLESLPVITKLAQSPAAEVEGEVGSEVATNLSACR